MRGRALVGNIRSGIRIWLCPIGCTNIVLEYITILSYISIFFNMVFVLKLYYFSNKLGLLRNEDRILLGFRRKSRYPCTTNSIKRYILANHKIIRTLWFKIYFYYHLCNLSLLFNRVTSRHYTTKVVDSIPTLDKHSRDEH